MIATTSLAVGGMYLLVWFNRRDSIASLMFALLAVSTAGIAAAEVWMMHAETTEEFGTALRFFHVPVLLAFIGFVGVAHHRLHTDRVWLGWTACWVRGVSLVIDFVQDPNLNYVEITHLERVVVLGEAITEVDGISSPWMLVGQLSLLILMVYILDAAATAWRQRKGWRSISVACGLAFLLIGGATQAVLGLWEIIQIPMMVTPFFMGITIVMGSELSLDLLQSARLERELSDANVESSQLRHQLAHLARVATANELSTTLAHELNQPLGVILSNAEAAQKLLENHSFDVPQFREIMADIVKADRRAADVITRLRDLLRRDDPNLKDLAINEAVEEVLALLRADFASRRIGLDTNLGHRLPLVRADRVLVVQVLLNLLTNASDAVADNSPEQREIVVTTSLKDGQIVVTVTDNGSGLPDAPESVFDPFFTTKDSGLGMGLAISRTIATSHDGKLWAESTPTGGTSFYFSLPGIRQAA